jgi:hypothetical protein
MTKDEALKLALESLDGDHIDRAYAYIQEALAQPVRSDCAETGVCIRSGLYVSALAQPMLEPKAWWDAKIGVFNEKHFDQLQPLYTAPPRREWVGLTGKEKDECEERLGHAVSSQVFDVIEDKLKEKNT